MAISNIRSGINSKRAAKLLENIAQQNLFNNSNSVFETDNEVTAFGQYRIKKSSTGCVILKRNVLIQETATLRSALSWCVADKYNLDQLKHNLIQYDHELARRETDVLHYIHTIRNSQDHELKNAVFDRLLECKDRIKWLKKKLDKCINSAKYCQQKGFDNETSRLGLQKPSREITKSF